ncbi:eukaryotic translation initiation factor 2D [Onthophagus taurus]|uniref:eukaryotic translation initiation factor 2D n=1 Tax=Onthophagus taurus TaxID=166361 RepID=UPI000C20D8BD|nr:eukaryotic translation initiation factor 2D [Onthophagus taurus]
MFKKPFRVKSNTPIKSSERKSLKESIRKHLPLLSGTDVDNLFPKKENASCMKIITSDNIIVQVYVVQKRAVAFEYNSIIYPTVYVLWKYDNIALNFTTNSFVFSKISGGADLMLPGVSLNPSGYGIFTQNQIASINTVENKACLAVGVTAMSSDQIQIHGKGKCVIVYHFYGDNLCTIEDMPLQKLPLFGPPAWLTTENIEESVNDETTEEEIESTEATSSATIVSSSNDDTDKLLMDCFLTAIKYSKTIELPILTSSFYKSQVLSVCPPDKVLDIKKTSFKKVGVFLKQMCKEGVIDIKEKKKGVETLEGINRDHQMLKEFYVEIDNRPKPQQDKPDAKTDVPNRNIIETYAITSSTEPIFKEFQLKKNDTLTKLEIRKYITEYVKSHNYQNEDNKRFVKIEGDLSHICKGEAMVTWEELMEKICASMKQCFKVTTGVEEIVSKGKLEPIVMTVQRRGGNKKVTLIDNLELYGIRIGEFAKECQHGVAASTSISRPPGKKCEELLVQGNQVLFVYNLLIDKYNIPKKYIRGLENAPKKK